MGAGAGNLVRVLGLQSGAGGGAPFWVPGSEAQVCCLFQRRVVTHLAGYFSWVARWPGTVPGVGEMGKTCHGVKLGALVVVGEP